MSSKKSPSSKSGGKKDILTPLKKSTQLCMTAEKYLHAKLDYSEKKKQTI